MKGALTNPKGWLIPRLQRGKGPTLLSASFGNLLIDRINALCRMQVVRGSANRFSISDYNSILEIKDLSGSTSTDLRFHPFKVFLSPLDPAAASSTAWRTFRVRAGAYGTDPISGTDGADACPDDPTVNPNPSYSSSIDFVVPASTINYYVWVDLTTEAIDHSSTIPGSGTDAAWWGGNYVLVATIDTLTNVSTSQAIVRQWIRDDIPKCS